MQYRIVQVGDQDIFEIEQRTWRFGSWHRPRSYFPMPPGFHCWRFYCLEDAEDWIDRAKSPGPVRRVVRGKK